MTLSRRLARRAQLSAIRHGLGRAFTYPSSIMPEPTKAAIAVPSKDPKKKEDNEKNGAVSKKKPDEKEGEELVRRRGA